MTHIVFQMVFPFPYLSRYNPIKAKYQFYFPCSFPLESPFYSKPFSFLHSLLARSKLEAEVSRRCSIAGHLNFRSNVWDLSEPIDPRDIL